MRNIVWLWNLDRISKRDRHVPAHRRGVMPDNPMPLREALREAVEALLDDSTDVVVMMDRKDLIEAQMAINARNAAMDRVTALIDQIPLVFEVNP